MAIAWKVLEVLEVESSMEAAKAQWGCYPGRSILRLSTSVDCGWETRQPNGADDVPMRWAARDDGDCC